MAVDDNAFAGDGLDLEALTRLTGSAGEAPAVRAAEGVECPGRASACVPTSGGAELDGRSRRASAIGAPGRFALGWTLALPPDPQHRFLLNEPESVSEWAGDHVGQDTPTSPLATWWSSTS